MIRVCPPTHFLSQVTHLCQPCAEGYFTSAELLESVCHDCDSLYNLALLKADTVSSVVYETYHQYCVSPQEQPIKPSDNATDLDVEQQDIEAEETTTQEGIDGTTGDTEGGVEADETEIPIQSGRIEVEDSDSSGNSQQTEDQVEE